MRIIFLLLSVTFLLSPSLAAAKQGSSFIFQQDNPGHGEISVPVSGQLVRGAVIIRGNTTVDGFLSYEIDFSYSSDTTQSWFLVQEGTSPVLQSILAVWDTSIITDGDYNLRLLINKTADTQEIIEITDLHVRNYTPIETQTPVLLEAAATSVSARSTMTVSPLVTATTVTTSVLPIKKAFPANPMEISVAQVGLATVKGVVVVLGLFAILGAYPWIRMFNNNHK